MPTPSRRWRRRALGLISGGLLGGMLASDANAQFPAPPGFPPGHAPAQPMLAPRAWVPPLMFVRVSGPRGMKATFFRGAAQGQTVETPCIVGLRPGYSYRVALSDIAEAPNRVFFPTLEVRASLLVGHRLKSADFPATLHFSGEDFARAGAGALITKIIVLERPDQAIPHPSKAEEPFEIRVPSTADVYAEAQERGQPLVLMHMGQRELAPEELAFTGVSGTALMPGEKVLAPPRFPPSGPWRCFPVVDPIGGPVDPSQFICLPNGGDRGMPIGFGPDGKLRGVDPSDTVAEYIDSKGRKRLAVSNRVELCVPRFIVARGETVPVSQVALASVGKSHTANGYDVVVNRQALQTQAQAAMLELAAQKQKASGTSNRYGTAVTGRVQGLEIKTSLRAVERVEGTLLRPEEPAAADVPLLIIKWPDKAGANIGEVVTFTLRFSNRGGQPITDVLVSDSLTPRFEYVAGSARTDREAIFTTQPNDAGSTVLRWQFSGVLQPSESGTVSFQVRVR
jgi:uncharacterized repeat protein (TIGR01451 family)